MRAIARKCLLASCYLCGIVKQVKSLGQHTYIASLVEHIVLKAQNLVIPLLPYWSVEWEV